MLIKKDMNHAQSSNCRYTIIVYTVYQSRINSETTEAIALYVKEEKRKYMENEAP